MNDESCIIHYTSIKCESANSKSPKSDSFGRESTERALESDLNSIKRNGEYIRYRRCYSFAKKACETKLNK